MSSNYLPTPLQEYVHKSRYARWLDNEGRREHWNETVDRYVNYFDNKFPHYPKAQVREAILNLEVMPSMRALMTAGPALDRDPIAGFNPVLGSTLVVTREYGNVPIKTLNGKSATVLNKNSEWATATFRSYGTQPLKKITLKLNSNTVKEVFATGNHRWVLSDGSVVSTNTLEKGDRIDFISAPKAEIDDDYILGIRHGLVYGDGTATRSHGRVKGYHIRLCGTGKDFLKYFEDYPVTYPPSMNGDPLVMLYDTFAATHDLKALPYEHETESYILGFIRGWFGADGHVGKKNPQVSICCNQAGKDWLLKNSERAGFVIQSCSTQPKVTNFGTRIEDSFVLRISRSSFTAEDVLSEQKKELVKELNSHYTVHSVEDAGFEDEVFCAEVPDTNTFVLAGGILTGNCSFIVVDDVRAFDEILYILMCGTGVGFSVERQFISNLPVVGMKVGVDTEGKVQVKFLDQLKPVEHTIVVRDSKGGWAAAFRELLKFLYMGQIPKWDVSKVRKAGMKLKTFGGRASGPQPLVDLFEFAVSTFKGAVGRKLTSVECHDLICKVADIVVVGGVRRSALISLSNLSDDRMRLAKSGQWWVNDPQRALANNSAVYTERPQAEIFMKEWLALIESKSGERGIFNRNAAIQKALESGRRDASKVVGTNPCAEITLRSAGLCNLSEVVVRAGDSLEDLLLKVETAVIIGTYQSMLVNFRYVRDIWKRNQEEERLLGVSMTGIMDHEVLSSVSMEAADWLKELREHAIAINKIWADKLGINQSVAITTVKPSGTVSQLVDSASGKHERYAPYYIRTVRGDKKDPLTQLMIAQGFPVEDDLTKPESIAVFSFPTKAPEHAVFRNDRTAIEQLEHYLMFQTNWSEHNVSNTIYVKDHEWMEVGAWVYKHFDQLAGVSFLPHSDHTYRQAPYQECTKEEYETLLSKMPEFDWNQLAQFEKDDSTINTKELACTAGACELVL